jgi:hypothetical protein
VVGGLVGGVLVGGVVAWVARKRHWLSKKPDQGAMSARTSEHSSVLPSIQLVGVNQHMTGKLKTQVSYAPTVSTYAPSSATGTTGADSTDAGACSPPTTIHRPLAPSAARLEDVELQPAEDAETM